tara:strand:+ start:10452 stop:10847 length:396 start_codon:yes stop_codon:yes gene_type:complete
MKIKNKFNELPNEIKKEIIIQCTIYNQQILANLLIQYDKLYHMFFTYKKKINNLYTNSNMQYYLNIYNNKKYTIKQKKNARYQLVNYYKPNINILNKEIKKINKEINTVKKEFQNYKKKYYYFFFLYKNLI